MPHFKNAVSKASSVKLALDGDLIRTTVKNPGKPNWQRANWRENWG
ncbi:hypothetical protein ACNKHW_01635 [Shigella flexneri]